MRTSALLSVLTLSCALAWPAAAMPGAGTPGAGPSVAGEVLEVLDVSGYTYLRLKTASGETWAAVSTTPVKKGAKVLISNAMPMENFESRALGRRFDRIVFGQINAPGSTTAGTPAAKGGMPSMMQALPGAAPRHGAPVDAEPVKVAKASGPEARTVAEVVQGKSGLKDKPVLVQARVVKVNKGILGKNWLHVQDGSGKAQEGTHDLLVTTQDLAAVGDIVTVRGTVRTDITIGPGYAYEVLVEDAKLRK